MKFHHLLPLLLLTACTSAKQEPQTAAETAAEPSSVITLTDGMTQVFWIKDNAESRLMPRDLFPEASDSLFDALGLTEGVPASVSTFLMKADGEWCLFDAGLGAMRGGQLLNGLAELGLTADSISTLYVTHFHGDHIGGLVNDGKPIFANAQLYVSQREYDAWINEMPEEQNAMQREVMEAYAAQAHLFAFGDTLAHDVIAIDAIGHTAGHAAYQKGNMIVIGDLMHGAALQLEHPEISGNYDKDKAQAAEARARLLNYAAENGLVMAGMHLPEPAFIVPQK